MEIRKATLNDIDTLIKLRIDYLIADRGQLTMEEEASVRAQLTAYFPKHMDDGFIACLAEVDGNVASTAFLAISDKPANPAFITGKTGTLLNVLTYPEYRRMGLATKVISCIIGEARGLGISYIELSATDEGKPLYKKLGFAEQKSKYTEMRLQLV